MPRRFAYIVVEGPHDIEFVARLLKPFGFLRVKALDDLDPYWVPLVPKEFPPDGDLLKRVPVPIFFQTATHAVAIESAIGISNIAARAEETLTFIQGIKQTPPEAVSMILDADEGKAPPARFADLVKDLTGRGVVSQANVPANLGNVTAGNPRWGIYVLPDNQSEGTLENILLECADQVYPNLKAGADTFVKGIDRTKLNSGERDGTKNAAGLNKAWIGCMSSVLRPGKAIQVSIQDNRWLDGATLNLPRVQAVTTFLQQLLVI